MGWDSVGVVVVVVLVDDDVQTYANIHQPSMASCIELHVTKKGNRFPEKGSLRTRELASFLNCYMICII